ncbi:MAG: PilT/PilU family type 4a pilus ATPase [Nitrospirae bacterium]|nr:MAG: PilT/PilU family type 4a pilus ATPase [Nitrospirota bacterium]
METDWTIHQLCSLLAERGGSDLHLVGGSPPRIRVDGRLHAIPAPIVTAADCRRFLTAILTESQQRTLDSQAQVDCSISVPEVGRFRCHVYIQRGSVALAIRAIPREIPTIEALGLPPVVRQFVRKPQGLILVTGPAGSGKSTTLAALLDAMNRERAGHIVTIEDPIEFQHTHKQAMVTQREIGSDIPDIDALAKGLLRMDPDIVCLGELRDAQAIQTAMTIAETGHLTLATMHTNTAIQTLHRVILAYPPHQQAHARTQVALALEGILCQRLVPRMSGKGRVLALEILVPTPAVRNLVREDKLHQIYSMMQTGQAKHGMQTMNQALADLVKQRIVAAQHAFAASSHPDELAELLRRSGTYDTYRANLARFKTR